MRDSGANLTGTPLFAVGICSGSTNIFGDATADHFVGVRTQVATWTRAAGPPVNYAINPVQAGKMVGTTWTAFSATNWISGSGIVMADATAGNRFCWFIDITKPTSYTIAGYHRNVTTAGDISFATFLAQAEVDAASLTNHTTSNSGTVAVDEGTNGTLDHVNVSWNRTTPEIEISDLAVVRLS